MLDQPANFSNEDFEIPMYTPFNEWPGNTSVVLPKSRFLIFSSSPRLFFLLFPFFAWLQLHSYKTVKDGGIKLNAGEWEKNQEFATD